MSARRVPLVVQLEMALSDDIAVDRGAAAASSEEGLGGLSWTSIASLVVGLRSCCGEARSCRVRS